MYANYFLVVKLKDRLKYLFKNLMEDIFYFFMFFIAFISARGCRKQNHQYETK